MEKNSNREIERIKISSKKRGRSTVGIYKENGLLKTEFVRTEESDYENNISGKEEYIIRNHEDYYLFLTMQKGKAGHPYPSPDKYKYGVITPDEYYIINPKQKYLAKKGNTKPKGRIYTRMLVHKALIKKTLQELNLLYPEEGIEFKTGIHKKSATLGNIIEVLASAVADEEPSSDLMVDSALYQFVIYLLQSHSGSHTPLKKGILKHFADDSRIQKTLDYLRDNYNKNITIDNLADTACLSKSHFLYLFRKKTGQTPSEYLMEFRMKRAMEYLKDKNKKISEISKLIGYTSDRQFYHLFITKLKQTPAQIRKNLLK